MFLGSLCGGNILCLTGAECDDRLLFGRPRDLRTIESMNGSGDGLAVTYIVGVVGIRVVDQCKGTSSAVQNAMLRRVAEVANETFQ